MSAAEMEVSLTGLLPAKRIGRRLADIADTERVEEPGQRNPATSVDRLDEIAR